MIIFMAWGVGMKAGAGVLGTGAVVATVFPYRPVLRVRRR